MLTYFGTVAATMLIVFVAILAMGIVGYILSVALFGFNIVVEIWRKIFGGK